VITEHQKQNRQLAQDILDKHNDGKPYQPVDVLQTRLSEAQRQVMTLYESADAEERGLNPAEQRQLNAATVSVQTLTLAVDRAAQVERLWDCNPIRQTQPMGPGCHSAIEKPSKFLR